MKNYYVKIMSVFLGLFILMYGYPVRADLPLQGKVIVVDSGHPSEIKPSINRTSCSKL